jgi:peptidoglycan/xylan/chitin deacetylase (PgdA/CDA1 family)
MQPSVGRLLSRLRRDRCAIVMMHRFAVPESARPGHDPTRLRTLLAHLRSIGVSLLAVDEAVQHYAIAGGHGSAARPPAVAVTVDDGYADFSDVGLPVFEEYDCPVTGFVVPDVIDGKRWFWWDQVEWALLHASRHRLALELDGNPLRLSWDSAEERGVHHRTLCERLKGVDDATRQTFLTDLSQVADVPVTSDMPTAYRVLSWDELRSCERRGARFGPHTMSHPILSRCTESQSRDEIVQASARVLDALENPSRVFCYPNGCTQDFGAREILALRSTGMMAAVSAVPGLVRPVSIGTDQDAIWRVPRFAYDDRHGVMPRLLFL